MALKGRQWWKLVGLAGAVGVAATGAVVMRDERRRRAYTPDEGRTKLHDRYARVAAAHDTQSAVPLDEVTTGLCTRIRTGLRRIRVRR